MDSRRFIMLLNPSNVQSSSLGVDDHDSVISVLELLAVAGFIIQISDI